MSNSFGFNAPATSQGVFELPLTGSLGPTEVLVGVAETLLADLTVVGSDHGVLQIQNLGPNPIFIAFNNNAGAGPGVTAANGIRIAAGAIETLDKFGGMALWAITTVAQVALAGTRVGAGSR